MEPLEAMVKQAGGRPLVLVNPLLFDRPSGNNIMQIQGRAERRAFADSFQDVFVFKLLYPSSGGYMFPIRGLVVKKNSAGPYVLYNKGVTAESKTNDGSKREVEEYNIVAAFPPFPAPESTAISNVFTGSR